MSNLTTTTQARLKAREDRLEARANMRLDRVKEKINYLKSNSGKMVIDDAIDSLRKTSPGVGRIASFINGFINKNREKKVASELAQERLDSNPTSSFSTRDDQNQNGLLSGIKSYLLPTLYSLGGMQLLSYSLKGTGRILRSGVGRLFGRGRKRK